MLAWCRGPLVHRWTSRGPARGPRRCDWIAYDDVEYGGDCSITLVVDAKVLTSGTAATTLKVRCAGDDFLEAVYACK